MIMNKVFQILSVAVIVWTAASCGGDKTTTSGSTRPVAESDVNTDSIMPDFLEFFETFVADEDFQSAHVKFSSASDVTNDDWYGWEGSISGFFENASMLKQSDSEYIWAALGNDDDVCVTFKKIDEQWYLTDIIYMDLP
jgi:hypothetical protein